MPNYIHSLLLLTLPLSGSLTTAHMAMTYPPPLKSKTNPHTSQSNIDYSLTSPLSASGSDFPCKGALPLLSTTDGTPVASWTPGQTYNFTIAGGAAHGGGSCQAALSVDGGESFRVLHSYEGGCPGEGESSFQFVLPRDVPAAERAVFAWTWFNRVGNREMYMNCAVVSVVKRGGGGREKVAFGKRPGLFVANVGNGCRTVEAVDVKFPDPGVDVDSKGDAAPPVGSCGASASSSGSDSGSGSGSGSGNGGSDGSGSGSGNSGESSGSSSGTSPSDTCSSEGSNSPNGCDPEPQTTPVPVTDDPGKGYTPGNDWPDWFQSDASRTVVGASLTAFLWVLFFAYHLL